jgi:hypothetical protein
MDEENMNNELVLVDERRSSRRRGDGYERDRSYVGMTACDEVRAEMLSDEEGNPQSPCFLVMSTHGFPLHSFQNREEAETFVRDNADAAEIVEIQST